MIEYKDFKDYLERSGDVYGAIYPGQIVLEEEGKGWCIMDVAGSDLIVFQCYGDGKYWDKEIERTAKAHSCKNIRFFTKRNYKAFERKFGYKLSGYVLVKEI